MERRSNIQENADQLGFSLNDDDDESLCVVVALRKKKSMKPLIDLNSPG